MILKRRSIACKCACDRIGERGSLSMLFSRIVDSGAAEENRDCKRSQVDLRTLRRHKSSLTVHYYQEMAVYLQHCSKGAKMDISS